MYYRKKSCGVCGSESLKKIINLNKFPLTGIFVKKKNLNFQNYYDQKINLCRRCGHLQLDKFVSRKILYNKLYANRTSISHLSNQSIKFFKNFLFKCHKKRKLGNILEIGCNDITLLQNLKKYSNFVYGIDPIWKGKEIKKNNFKVLGDFVENINLKKKIKKNINLFLTTHNLEHIDDPYAVLKKIVEYCDKETLFFIEVPDADLMIKNFRFDQIFHQHYHYFNFRSLKNLISHLKCKIVNKKINYEFWGGSLLVCFKKDYKNINVNIKSDYSEKNKKILKNYKSFKNHYYILSQKLKKEKNLIGFGAGQMLPSLAYHLNSDLSFLQYILDDNKQRANFKYPNLKPKIKFFSKRFIKDKNVLITALDGAKSISKKLRKNNIKFINPLLNIK